MNPNGAHPESRTENEDDEPDWHAAQRTEWIDAVAAGVVITTSTSTTTATVNNNTDIANKTDVAAQLSTGVEVWEANAEPPRPQPDPAMFYGPIGKFARKVAEHSEADPVAVLGQALTFYGAACNRGAHLLAGNDHHGPALNALVVGRSAKGAKGTAYAPVRVLFSEVDPGLMKRIMGGFGSGESVIEELAPDPQTGKVADNRLLVMESEFGGMLARCRRENSILGQVLRDGWDGRPLANRTKGTGRLVATDYHLAAIGHITRDELRARLSNVEIFGGTVNRWLHFWSERGQLRPDGGNVPAKVITEFANDLTAKLTLARKIGLMARTPEADKVWRKLYGDLAADDPPGLLGHVVSRAAAQVLRLSIVYALADGQRSIDAAHVDAANATWRYCRASAARIYGDSTGNLDADNLLKALRAAGAAGLDSTAANRIFSNRTGAVDRARQVLTDLGLVATVDLHVPGRRGRPTRVTVAIRPKR